MYTLYNIKKASALLIALSSLLFVSCLHDNEEAFSMSAAERIEEAVVNDKAILESAPNGWHMTLWTSSNYGGGGYNMFLKFKNGKVEVKSDIAPSDMTIKSSYDVIKDQGPVLTFNTYNEIMHYMANPSSSLLEGLGGDYEFIIQKATTESIVLKGRKSQNIIEMTRNADNLDIETTIQEMQATLKQIAGFYQDGQSVLAVDPSQRRLYPDVLNETSSLPYAPTPTGLKIAGLDSEISWNASTQLLTYGRGRWKSVTLDGYNSISSWIGDWNLRYLNSSTSRYDSLRLTLEPATDLIEQQSMGSLTGKFEVEGYTFELIVYYSPLTGMISIPAQYIDDPTNTYNMFLLLGCDAYSESGLSWYAVDWNFEYDKTSGNYLIVGDSSNANGNDMNTMMLLAVNSSGELISNSEGQVISLLTLMFPDYLSRVTNE